MSFHEKLLKSATLPAEQSSLKFDGLYGGDYIVSQIVPQYYDSYTDDAFFFNSHSESAKSAKLSSGTDASLSRSATTMQCLLCWII